MGIWFDAAMPGNDSITKNYQRLVSRIGYSIFLGSGHNNVLLEMVAGGGYTWGTPPVSKQYFAGNSQRNYLYQPLLSIRNQQLQTGPLMRSLGENEGGLYTTGGNTFGGSSFWHFNFNFSIPISKWAKPLIPDITISEEPRKITLRSALKAQAETAKNFIYDDLVNNHGYPDTDATDSAASVIIDRDIRPALNYLSDRANVYSIKPMILFDISHLNDHILPGRTFTGVGIGLQVTVVIARLGMGYMRTLSPTAYSSQGNFFLQFVLQNFY